MNSLNLITAYLKFNHFICPDFSLLNQAMTGYNNKKFPFAVVPVLTLCDTGLRDVDTELTMVNGFHQFSE